MRDVRDWLQETHSAGFELRQDFAALLALLAARQDRHPQAGAFGQARKELRLALAENAKSTYGKEARLLLNRLENVRTK